MEHVKAEVRQIVQLALRDAGMDVDVTDDMSLVESGLLDSLSVITVVQHLQRGFDINVSVADITVEVFDSVNAISGFVENRSG